jgi:DNA polymerase-4
MSESKSESRISSAPYILHVDADAFYASVEQVLRPELKGKPVIVGGTSRGVVSAASYEARRFGVHSAMPTVQARKLCPQGIFLRPNFQAYKEFSGRMFTIMRKYSPAVEVTSIDEGYMDLSGTFRLHRAPAWEVASRILQEIRRYLSIDVSGGLAGSKSWAKMATGLAKPNGLLYLEPDQAMIILGKLPVNSIPGVGKKAHQVLKRYGISTVDQLASAGPRTMQSLLGKWGEKLIEIAAGGNPQPVRTTPREAQKSYSKDRTLDSNTIDYGYLRSVACELAEKLAAKLREHDRAAATVTLRVRYSDFRDASRSMTLQQPLNGNREIVACVDRLFWKTITRRTSVRLVGVKLSGIVSPSMQTDLFDPRRPLRAERDRAVDVIRSRYGFGSIGARRWVVVNRAPRHADKGD